MRVVLRTVCAFAITISIAVSATPQANFSGWIAKVEDPTVKHVLAGRGARLFFGSRKQYAHFAQSWPVPGVTWQPNYVYRVSSERDPDSQLSWGLHNFGQAVGSLAPGLNGADVGAEAAYQISVGDRAVVVAIIDSGIDVTHEDLSANIWVNRKEIPGNGRDDDGNGLVDDSLGWDFIDSSSNVHDGNGHGTLCAGIIGAIRGNGKGSHGVCPVVSLMAVRALNEDGLGSTASTIAAIEYAVREGAKIINASWGGTTFDPALYETVQWATQSGVVFITAAGNDGKNNDTDSAPIYPAAFRLPGQITVAAYDNSDRLASFSNFGPKTTSIGAPGISIFSTLPGGEYGFVSGTSFAAPFVSGVAALLVAHEPHLVGQALRDRILSTSSVINRYELAHTASAGRVRADTALINRAIDRPFLPQSWNSQWESIETSHPYKSSESRIWRIRIPGATLMRLKFASFDTEACCDAVVLRDAEGRVVGRYAGPLEPFTTQESEGDTLQVEFESDATVNRVGFQVDLVEYTREKIKTGATVSSSR